MVDIVFEYGGIPIIALIIGLNEVLKRQANMPSWGALVVNFVLGMASGLFLFSEGDIALGIVNGLFIFTSATGAFSFGKNFWETITESDYHNDSEDTDTDKYER